MSQILLISKKCYAKICLWDCSDSVIYVRASVGLTLKIVIIFSVIPPREWRAVVRVLGCISWGHLHSRSVMHLLVFDSVAEVIEAESNFCSQRQIDLLVTLGKIVNPASPQFPYFALH